MSKNLSGDLLYEILRNYDANKLDDNYKRSNSNEYLIGKHLENMLEEKDSNNLKYYFMCGIIHELAPNNPVIVVQEIKQDEDKKEISRDESESQIYGEASIKEWMKTSKTDPMNREPILGLKSVQPERSKKLFQCFEKYRNKLSDKEQEEVNKVIDGILNKIMLFEAVRRNNVDEVRELISKGADVNAKDNKGKTPLYYATEKGYTEVVKLLVRAKAYIMYYCIDIAKEKGFAEIIDILCDQEEKNDKLYYAAEKGNLSGVEEAIKSGADINTKNMLNSTSLHIASIKGRSEVVKFLLENGAEINVIDQFGHTPLHWAVDRCRPEVVKLLCKHGADVNDVDNHGNTAIHSAAQQGFLEIVEILLQSGADINLTDNDGDTTLHCAAYGGNLDTVKLLIKKGADVNAKNGEGKTPLDMAKDKGFTEIVDIIHKYQPCSNLDTTNVEAGKQRRNSV